MVGSSVRTNPTVNIVVDHGHAYAIMHIDFINILRKSNRQFINPVDCAN